MSEINDNSELKSDQKMSVDQLKRWAKTEVEFEGRLDEDYILLFLRSCDFNLELSKTTFRKYYENRVKYPEWLTNRDVRNPNLNQFLQMRAGESSTNFDNMNKVIGLALETVARRRSCQLSGNVILIDFDNCPWWLVRKLMWPSVCKAMLNAFLFGLPVKTQAFAVVNSPLMAKAIMAICEPFFTPGFRHKVHLLSDWSKVGSLISIDRLPTEFGGTSGPMKHHEDAFIEELTRINDDLIQDDENFGFKQHQKLVGPR